MTAWTCNDNCIEGDSALVSFPDSSETHPCLHEPCSDQAELAEMGTALACECVLVSLKVMHLFLTQENVSRISFFDTRLVAHFTRRKNG